MAQLLAGRKICLSPRSLRFVPNALPLYVEFRSVVLHVNLPSSLLFFLPYTHTHTYPFHDFVFVSMRLLITRLPAFHDNYFNYVDAAGDIYRKLIENRLAIKIGPVADSRTYRRCVFNCFFRDFNGQQTLTPGSYQRYPVNKDFNSY